MVDMTGFGDVKGRCICSTAVPKTGEIKFQMRQRFQMCCQKPDLLEAEIRRIWSLVPESRHGVHPQDSEGACLVVDNGGD